MSVGSVLVGIALTLVVGVYLARPFRVVITSENTNLDQDIEAWVAQVRAEGQGGGGVEMPVNFCSRCGRRVGPDDRFCPGCGTRLQYMTGNEIK